MDHISIRMITRHAVVCVTLFLAMSSLCAGQEKKVIPPPSPYRKISYYTYELHVDSLFLNNLSKAIFDNPIVDDIDEGRHHLWIGSFKRRDNAFEYYISVCFCDRPVQVKGIGFCERNKFTYWFITDLPDDVSVMRVSKKHISFLDYIFYFDYDGFFFKYNEDTGEVIPCPDSEIDDTISLQNNASSCQIWERLVKNLHLQK